MTGWPKFKTKDEVPEAFRAGYHEVGGEWVAKEDDGLQEKGKKALDAMKSERDAAAARAGAAEAKAKEAEEQAAALRAGITAEDAKKFREETARAIRAEVQGEQDALKAKLLDYELSSPVKDMAHKAGVLDVEAWWTLNGGRFERGADGKPKIKGDETGKDVTTFITGDLKKERPFLYAGTMGDGGGAGGLNEGRGGTGTLTFEQIQKQPALALGHTAK